MKNTVALYLSLFLSTQILSAHAAQLNYGKYFGTVQMNGHPEVIAISLDAFVTQGSDPKNYPALDIIVRANLGGYFGSEYVGYEFHDPTFNFENSVLSLSDPKNNLTATLHVINNESQTILEGPVVERLTNSKGNMRVVMDLEDNSSVATPAPSTAMFLSELRGEYRGKCSNQDADLRIETGRAFQPDAPGNALTGYSITGRLGFQNGPLCAPGTSGFCSIYPYSSGSYSPFSNRIVLHNTRGTLDCTKLKDELKCTVNGFYASGPCMLSKNPAVTTGPSQIPTGIFMDVAQALKSPLPAPNPPENDDLLKTLNGNFYGFLHHENRDEYQLVELSVIATTSTENPHIQNRVMIEPTLVLRLGNSWDEIPIQSLFFPQRGFYQPSGLEFKNESNDIFAVIGDWRTGYISGVLYSRTYGRIGTFEMQRDLKPSVRNGMMMVASPAGNFLGPQESSSPLKGFWSLAVAIPNDGIVADMTSVPLRARYLGTNIMGSFDSASFDLNTSFLAFLIKDPAGDRLVTGTVTQDNSLKLLWPVGPALGAPMDEYQSFTYPRQKAQEN